ncbi:hypothetical protein [Methylocaldum szegediense]|uniref:hypothetical protein n=1 Tax=Methylocaldum szegediense TaxID=73780 RepID=UPI000418BB2D|nr:hypothetical protein [Methylocaldum szegediense]
MAADVGLRSKTFAESVAANRGDVWVQDRIKAGYCSIPWGRTMPILVHWPRIRANSVWLGHSQNLAALVDSYFRSTDPGVFDDLITQVFGFQDIGGYHYPVSFVESQHALLDMGTLGNVEERLVNIMYLLSGQLKDKDKFAEEIGTMLAVEPVTLEEKRERIGKTFALIKKIAAQLRKEYANERLYLRTLHAYVAEASRLKRDAEEAVPSPRPKAFSARANAKKHIDMWPKAAGALYSHSRR